MKKVFLAGLIVIILLLAGCPQPTDSEPKYTVWTDVWSYAYFRSELGTLNDGYYWRIELTNSQFKTFILPDNTKHDWTGDQIHDWLIGRGFGETEASREKSWLITTEHAFLASRDGNMVDILVK